jgi:large conductance mechanosensitive channel
VTLGKTEVPFASIEVAKEAGVATLNYGMFIQAVIDFLIIALCIFLIVKAINSLRKKEAPAAPAPAPRLCSFCRLAVADDATRCPHCTSELKK